MNQYKRIEAIQLLEQFGYVNYTFIEDGVMVEATANHLEDLEYACSVYGGDNVFF